MSEPSEPAGAAALRAAVAKHHPEADLAALDRAHEELQRRDLAGGAALAAARVLADMRLDLPAVTAALLSPLVTKLDVPQEELVASHGDEVGTLLEGVRRLSRIRWDRIEEEAAETLRRMFLAMAQDVRVVLVVLALRVEMLRALSEQASAERQRMARETLEVFAPLANRLGIWQLKWKLEDWSLEVLEPETYAELHAALAERREERTSFVEEALDTLRAKLSEEGIEAEVKGRAKHIYSIYNKMQRKNLELDEVYDVTAVRVMVARLTDCYAALGVVHSMWTPIPNEFDDYIAKPKPNGYQSLHTAVIGPRGRPLEVQIRTREMHQFAEFGVAAHWAYKEGKRAGGQDRFMLLRQLMDWEREVSDPHQFVESLKTDIFKDQVYVFTPNGDVIDMPVGATPLDFAYRIHTMVGHRCRGAKVNDKIQPLDHQLKTGDRIEILTQKKPQPSRDWMNPSFGYLVTSSARAKVRQWFRQQGRDEAIQAGRELVEKELARLELEHATLETIAELLKYPSVEDLFAHVGYGDRGSQSVASAALSIEKQHAPPPEPELPQSVPADQKKRVASGIRIDDISDVLGKRARCCNPVPGDRVVGFVTRGRGLVIHRRDCKSVVESREPERIVDIDWGPGEEEKHAVEVEIRANDRPGLLRDLTNLVSNMGVNMASARAEGNKDGSAWLRLSLELRSADEVVRVLERIDRHRDVLNVRRLSR